MGRIQGLTLFWVWLLSIYLLIMVVAGASPNLGRSSFPKGFKFGAGSAAYQVEGAAREGGKGPSIWDTFSHIPGKMADGNNGDIAVDQYHRYKEDIQHLKYMGMDIYRFSISWPRIFPSKLNQGSVLHIHMNLQCVFRLFSFVFFFTEGSPRHGRVNEEGIAHYNNLINELLKNGIEPFVTLFHWDMPQALEDEYGGFRSKKIVEDFGIFAEECFRAFGDRVKYWVTINEPFTTCYFGYDAGLHAPGRCSPGFGNCTAGNSATEPYIVAHNMLLAHSAAVKIYRAKYQRKQKGFIGMTLAVSWMEPFTQSLPDKQATQRAIDFRIGWFLDPLTSGKYPDSMRILVGARLPQFTTEEAKELKGSFDFLGYNYYTAEFIIDNPIPPNPRKTDYILDARAIVTYEVNGVYIGSAEGVSDFRSYPAGIRNIIIYTKNRYNNPPIYITETGYVDSDNGTTLLEQALNDSKRVKYHSEHLSYVLQAIREGADVRGYVAWSLLDSLEWSSGYSYRFGLYYVDYHDNLKRYARASAHWFKHFLKIYSFRFGNTSAPEL